MTDVMTVVMTDVAVKPVELAQVELTPHSHLNPIRNRAFIPVLVYTVGQGVNPNCYEQHMSDCFTPASQ